MAPPTRISLAYRNLCNHPQDELRSKLVKTVRDVETAAFVGERVRDAIAVLKPCATEATRREFLSLLAGAAPPRLGERDPNGMIRRVANFLNVRRGKRSKNQGGRPFAFSKAIDMRAKFDAATLQKLGPLGHVFAEGQPVLTRHGLAEIARFTAHGGVVITYRHGDAYEERTYTSREGKHAGGQPKNAARSALSVDTTTRHERLSCHRHHQEGHPQPRCHVLPDEPSPARCDEATVGAVHLRGEACLYIVGCARGHLC